MRLYLFRISFFIHFLTFYSFFIAFFLLMTTQPSKLYRSNVSYMSVTVLPPKDFNLTHDFQIDCKFKRHYSNKNTLASTGSQDHLKSKNLNQSIEATK